MIKLTQNVEQQIYNNTVNYDSIVSEFVNGITFKKGVKRVNFLTFNMEGSFLDRFIPFMEREPVKGTGKFLLLLTASTPMTFRVPFG